MATEYDCHISQAALDFAAQHLNETQENRDKSVREIKVWLESSKAELHARTDYVWILSFLRCAKFDIEKAKTKIRNHLTIRATCPEWFENRDPLLPELKQLLELGLFVPLRKPDNEGRLVVIIRTGGHNPKTHQQVDVFKVGKMVLDVALKQMEEATIFGVVAIFDMNNVTLGHALQLTPALIKKSVSAWQNYPCKPKSLDFVYAPSYINVVLNIFRRFMNEKLRGRVHVHGIATKTLEEVTPKEILPEEYGGECGRFSDLVEYWHQQCIDQRDWFKDDEQYKALL